MLRHLGAIGLRHLSITIAVFCAILPPVLAEQFSQFRGPGGSGVVASAKVPESWSIGGGQPSSNVAWKATLPGSGWSQPVIWNDLLFVTSAVAAEDLKPKNFADGVKTPQSMGLGFFSKPPEVEIEWTLFCLNKQTGEVQWQQVVGRGRPEFAIHPSNTYATETPAVDEVGVYAYFGALGMVAGFGHAGEPLWKREVGAYPTSNSFGTGSSLAIHEGKLFVQNLTEKSADLICIDARRGEVAWQKSRDQYATSWSSPALWKNSQRTELIVSGGEQVDSFDPQTGDSLWTLSNVKAATACSVCTDSQKLYFGGSDPFSTGPLFAVQSGGSGDLSPKKKNTEFDNCAWVAKRSAPGMASPVSTGKYIYIAEKNILRCYDAATGERLYQERLPNMGMVNASPLIVGERVLLIDEEGRGILIKTGPKFDVAGGGSVNDTVWSTPAVDDDSIYVRGVDGLYCIRDSK